MAYDLAVTLPYDNDSQLERIIEVILDITGAYQPNSYGSPLFNICCSSTKIIRLQIHRLRHHFGLSGIVGHSARGTHRYNDNTGEQLRQRPISLGYSQLYGVGHLHCQ